MKEIEIGENLMAVLIYLIIIIGAVSVVFIISL
ncbi:MAG: hypothetical protein UR73_C0038G0012 [candidate division WS6 bacterium GW2011_GWF1_35_23]|uniref:Uncharacterized protein n=1 Tax=candidate division WS6 bacterium GW2011_GWF1_35_23 TaxID=1619097 RepID=A0A0G0BYZ7_9BACT|nr:MAG: hypothetical protein UR73_C0038G0012 [candidate division WS6 bacterium GW2011_GWF1_35_23]KKQ29796.1 MAG: hypothetical protein US46_C0017G0012 [Candidatus Shapirobacteria bacterium GW2011_GWF2_37_20]